MEHNLDVPISLTLLAIALIVPFALWAKARFVRGCIERRLRRWGFRPAGGHTFVMPSGGTLKLSIDRFDVVYTVPDPTRPQRAVFAGETRSDGYLRAEMAQLDADWAAAFVAPDPAPTTRPRLGLAAS